MLESVRTNSSVGDMSRGFSTASSDSVVDADAGGDEDDTDVVDTVTDGATDSVDGDEDDFDDGDDNDDGDDCEINDVVLSVALIDEDSVIVLDDDNSDDNTGVTSNFPS